MTHVADEAPDRLGLNAVLIRPDGAVAWTSKRDAEARSGAEAMARWFGPPDD